MYCRGRNSADMDSIRLAPNQRTSQFCWKAADSGLSVENRSAAVSSGTRQISQASLEVYGDRSTKIPFSGNRHSYDSSILKMLNNIGLPKTLLSAEYTVLLV